MARFYASVQGNRGEATRMGTKKSGVKGHIRGWRVGIKVVMRYNEEKGEDEALVYLTKGSGGSESRLVGTFNESSWT